MLHCRMLLSRPARMLLPASPAGCTSLRFFIRDVYKDLQYEAPFTKDEKEVILKKLNSSSSPEELNACGVTKVMAPAVMRHLLQLRSLGTELEALEQLLDVKKVDPAAVERLGRAVLRRAKLTDKEEESRVSRSQSKLQKQIRPLPTEAQRLEAKSVLALKFNLASLSYAHLPTVRREGGEEESGCCPVLDWGTVPLFEKAYSKAPFEHHRLYSKCQEVFSLMPAADLYVFEESASILSRDPLMFTKMRQFLFETALVAQINGGKTENRTFCMKMSVLNSLFSLRVGLERVMIQHRIREILQPTGVSPSEEMWTKFKDPTMQKATREQMALSLLVASAFRTMLI